MTEEPITASDDPVGKPILGLSGRGVDLLGLQAIRALTKILLFNKDLPCILPINFKHTSGVKLVTVRALDFLSASMSVSSVSFGRP